MTLSDKKELLAAIENGEVRIHPNPRDDGLLEFLMTITHRSEEDWRRLVAAWIDAHANPLDPRNTAERWEPIEDYDWCLLDPDNPKSKIVVRVIARRPGLN